MGPVRKRYAESHASWPPTEGVDRAKLLAFLYW